MTSRQLDADKKISRNPLRSSQGCGRVRIIPVSLDNFKNLTMLNCRKVAGVLILKRFVLTNNALRDLRLGGISSFVND